MKVITIGRSTEGNDVIIDDPWVSRHHFQIVQDDDGSFRLADFGSTNGTYINGQRVNGEVDLDNNDIIRVGNTIIPWRQYFKVGLVQTEEPVSSQFHAQVFSKFEEFIKKCTFESFDDLMFILPHLPLLKIRKGYVLDAFKEGIPDFGWEYKLFCRKKLNPIVRLFGDKKMAKFEKRIHDGDPKNNVINFEEAKDFPCVMPYFYVPFTEEGIIQAWLLNNVTEFMPKFWHANYTHKTFVFDTESIRQDGHIWEKIKTLDINSLLPFINVTGEGAVLEYAYWNDWSGLVKVKTNVVRNNYSVKFQHSENDVLIEYDCHMQY